MNKDKHEGRSMTLNDSARTFSHAKHARRGPDREGTEIRSAYGWSWRDDLDNASEMSCPVSRDEKTRAAEKRREREKSKCEREHNENEEHAWKPRLVDLNSGGGESISCLPTCLLACQPAWLKGWLAPCVLLCSFRSYPSNRILLPLLKYDPCPFPLVWYAYNPSWERKATRPSSSSELTELTDRINIRCAFVRTSN